MKTKTIIVDSVVVYKDGGEKKQAGPGKVTLPEKVAADVLERGRGSLAGEVVEEQSESESDAGPTPGTVPWLKAELDKKGISYTSDDKKPALEKLLADADKPKGDGFTEAQIVEAISGLDEDDESLWTEDRKPMVVAIEAVLGGNITEAQRDNAWESMQD